MPWVYGEDQANNMARLLDVKHRLMPYIYNLAVKATTTGRPIQRAMFLEFPLDKTAQYLDMQYMFGPDLLVAPVFVTEGEASDYYIPEGIWTSFFHPERKIVGPKWIQECVGLDEIPVFVRPGTVLALGPAGLGRPDYDFGKGLELRLYEIEDGQKVSTDIPGVKNAEIVGNIHLERTKNTVKILLTGQVSLDTVNWVSSGSFADVQGGKVVEGGIISVDDKGTQVVIELA